LPIGWCATLRSFIITAVGTIAIIIATPFITTSLSPRHYHPISITPSLS
jgi:hypothetical protein